MGKMKNVEIALQNYFDGEMPSLEQVDHALEHEVDESDRKYVECIRSMVMENLRREQEKNNGSTNNSCMDETDGQFNEVDDVEDEEIGSAFDFEEKREDKLTTKDSVIVDDGDVFYGNEKRRIKAEFNSIKKVKSLNNLKNEGIDINKCQFVELKDEQNYYIDYKDFKKLIVYMDPSEINLNYPNAPNVKTSRPEIINFDFFKKYIPGMYEECDLPIYDCIVTFWNVYIEEQSNSNIKIEWELLVLDKYNCGRSGYTFKTNISSAFELKQFHETLAELGIRLEKFNDLES